MSLIVDSGTRTSKSELHAVPVKLSLSLSFHHTFATREDVEWSRRPTEQTRNALSMQASDMDQLSFGLKNSSSTKIFTSKSFSLPSETFPPFIFYFPLSKALLLLQTLVLSLLPEVHSSPRHQMAQPSSRMKNGNNSTSSSPVVEPSLLVKVKSESPSPQASGAPHSIFTSLMQQSDVGRHVDHLPGCDVLMTDQEIWDSAQGLGNEGTPPCHPPRANHGISSEMAREARRMSTTSIPSTSESSESSEGEQLSGVQAEAVCVTHTGCCVADAHFLQACCGEELEAVWQTLRTGFRGLETAHLTINAMNITARRAADKVRKRNVSVRGSGNIDTISNFQARRYFRRTRSLLRQVERTMKMLLREEPRVLQAICTEKKRHNRISKMAKRSRTRPAAF